MQPANYPRGGYIPENTATADGLAIASLVLGVLSLILFCLWCVALPFAILAVVFGVFGLKGRNRQIAIAGMICAGISAFGAVFFMVLTFRG